MKSLLLLMLLLLLPLPSPAQSPAPAPESPQLKLAQAPAPAPESPQFKMVQPPAVAGSWYPADPTPLRELLKKLLAAPKAYPVDQGTLPIRALIVPHAGYQFSGATAAAAFKLVEGKSYSRVVVIGPAHRAELSGLALPVATHLATPLGEIPVDRAAVEQLTASPLARELQTAFTGEHSLEMELPFLQQVLAPGWQLVPILVGHTNPEQLPPLAELILPLLDKHTLLVISGDFTHFGPNYGYEPFAAGSDPAIELRKLDLGAWQLIAARDSEGFASYHERTGITACAFGPVSLLLNLLGAGSKPQLVAYHTSGELAGDYTNSVSYLAAVVRDAHPLAQRVTRVELDTQRLQLLLDLARQALTVGVTAGESAVDPDRLLGDRELPEELQYQAGAFVTLKKHGELRGCIGHIIPIQPLYRSVAENAVNAALHDPRFPPVTPEELKELDLEVSVLSPLRPIAGPEEFKVGLHGVVLSKNGRQAVFLPEVAVEQGWDREQTLTQLSLKAGLPPDAWMSGARFQVYTSRSVAAPYVK